MKNRLSSLFLVGVCFTSTAQWTQIWADEFTDSTLNTNNWTSEIGGWGWGNNENQYYTNGDNLSFANGELTITAKQEQFGSNAYTSGKLSSKGKFEIRYGKIEARLKMPLGQGLWPAFWMLGANIDQVNWPSCGEIDIMEHINNEMVVHGTAHWNQNGHVYFGNGTSVNPSFYHVYTIEWNASDIRWFVDGNLYFTQSILNNVGSTEEFHLPYYLILNLAVGGNWPGYPDPTTPFPSDFVIDYVRAYKLDAELGLEAINTELTVSPNPIKSALLVTTEQRGDLKIVGLNGITVFEKSLESSENQLDLSHLAAGMYMCTVVFEDGNVKQAKFVKE